MCLSCNYWFDKSLNKNEPYIKKCLSSEKIKKVSSLFKKQIKNDNSEIYLWCDKQGGKKTTMQDFLENKKYKDI